ncbi:MAG: SAM-dependent methyltransferase [Magnetovibrionaceae bacterium]
MSLRSYYNVIRNAWAARGFWDGAMRQIFLKLGIADPLQTVYQVWLFNFLTSEKRSSRFKSVMSIINWQAQHYDNPRIPEDRLKYWKELPQDEYGLQGTGDGHLPGMHDVLERYMDDLIKKGDVKTICELGCVHGSALYEMAKRYPDIHFVGIDLNVDYGKAHYQADNLTFIGDYIFDMDEILPGGVDLMFSVRTVEAMTPAELPAFFDYCAKLKVRRILHMDEMVFGMRVDAARGKVSRVIKKGFWYHNYPAYVADSPYEIVKIEIDRSPTRHRKRGEHRYCMGDYRLRSGA